MAQDLGMGQRPLYDILIFYRAFPIVHARAKLTWTHYRAPSTIPDATARRVYLQAAEKTQHDEGAGRGHVAYFP